tara:strand:+ start:1742 stop:2047 length:306 start_codon:yes stop_codon:yes gene_type:complete
MTNPDDMMLEIISTLKETTPVPDVGRYYTFIYKPKTPEIRYDEYPLIACVGLYKWGFRGINYHWGDFRNYDWMEVVGNLHLIYPLELSDMRSIPYQKIQYS